MITYTIQREEKSESKTRKSEFQLSLPQLLSNEDGCRLLRDWTPSPSLKNGNFSFDHRIVEQLDLDGHEMYKIKREIRYCSPTGIVTKPNLEIYLVPIEQLMSCTSARIMLDKWEAR